MIGRVVYGGDFNVAICAQIVSLQLFNIDSCLGLVDNLVEG